MLGKIRNMIDWDHQDVFRSEVLHQMNNNPTQEQTNNYLILL
jgi:hypothetical protein